MRNKRKAFTLAEVLITLTLIGALSALTIPSLVNNINNITSVVQLKKVYADFQQAFMLLQADNGGSIVPVFQNDTTTNYGNGNALNEFLTKLNYVRNCGNAKGCWYDTPRYNLSGVIDLANYDTALGITREKAILVTGTIMGIEVLSTDCTHNPTGSTPPLQNNVCATIFLDINGANSPNKIGRDFFAFWLTKTGIYPWGSFNDGYSCNVNPGDRNNSLGCTAKVLTEGAMNY